MATSPPSPRFALDHNFPLPIVLPLVQQWLPELQIDPLPDIDARLTHDLEDWEVIQALWQLRYEGFITTDTDLLWVPEVIAIVEQTKFSVVACEDAGHDPLKASGLLLLKLPFIARRHDSNRPQIWALHATETQARRFGEHRNLVETQSNVQISSLFLDRVALQRPVLP